MIFSAGNVASWTNRTIFDHHSSKTAFVILQCFLLLMQIWSRRFKIAREHLFSKLSAEVIFAIGSRTRYPTISLQLIKKNYPHLLRHLCLLYKNSFMQPTSVYFATKKTRTIIWKGLLGVLVLELVFFILFWGESFSLSCNCLLHSWVRAFCSRFVFVSREVCMRTRRRKKEKKEKKKKKDGSGMNGKWRGKQ